MIRNSINYKIIKFISKKRCRDSSEIIEYAKKELGISEQNAYARLSELKKKKYISVYKVKQKNKIVTRYCYNTEVF